MSDSELTPAELEFLEADLEADNRDTGAVTADWNAEAIDPRQFRQQLEVFESFHRDIANRFAVVLTRCVQRSVDVRLVDIRWLTFSQFVYQCADPTCFFVVRAHPLPTPLALHLDPSALYPLLDGMLGGGRRPASAPQRPPTQLEQRLARRAIELVLEELHDAWEPLLSVELSIDRIETHPQSVRLVPPAESVVSLEFQVRVADQSGPLIFCLPHRAIRKMLDKLVVGEFHANEGLASAHPSSLATGPLDVPPFFTPANVSMSLDDAPEIESPDRELGIDLETFRAVTSDDLETTSEHERDRLSDH